MNDETAKKSLDPGTPEPTATPDNNARLTRLEMLRNTMEVHARGPALGSAGRDKLYLGDGVYIQHDGWNLILTTENGIDVTNTIHLEPPVFDALEKYVRARRAEAQRLSKAKAAIASPMNATLPEATADRKQQSAE